MRKRDDERSAGPIGMETSFYVLAGVGVAKACSPFRNAYVQIMVNVIAKYDDLQRLNVGDISDEGTSSRRL